jgi:hypothetical protein
MIIFRILTLIPFVGVMIAAYAVMAMLGMDLSSVAYNFTAGEVNIDLTNGDMLVLLGLFALALEMIKATNTRGWSLGNHGLSMMILIIALGLFLLTEGYGTVTFLLLTVMALVDVLVGMMVTIVTARRDFGGFSPS